MTIAHLGAEQLHEALLAKCPARDNSEWLATVAAREEECPGNGALVQALASPLAVMPVPDTLGRTGSWP